MTATTLAIVEQAAADLNTQIVESVKALPLPIDDIEARQRWNLHTATVGWLRSRRTDRTRRAYFKDLTDFLRWCERTGLAPRDARRGDVDAYVADRCAHLSNASKARRLSTISSWYKYLISNEVAATNPVMAVDRPHVDHDDSPTIGLSSQQVTAFIRAARAQTGRTACRDAALLGMLASLGMRVGEVLGLDFDAFRHHRGHRAVRVVGKGHKPRTLPITAPLGEDLDAYLEERAAAAGVPVDQLAGPVFVTRTGKRVDQPAVFRLVRLVAAAAGIPDAGKLSPHSLRHTALTAALDKGASLRDVQDWAGHADTRTTRRYDRDRHNLDRSPAYLIASLFARDQ